jgi:hypothetical protein
MLCFIKKEEKSRHKNRVFYAFQLKLIVGYCILIRPYVFLRPLLVIP